ncbi:MAG: hypothetical protein HYU36_01345 [Planctomycetes bacterium]|nr:hypothetical protein [Planctomycetota bacterium]
MARWILLMTTLFVSDISQALMKRGVDRIGGLRLRPSGLLAELSSILHSPYIMGGIILYGLGMVFWLKVLGDYRDFIQVIMLSKLHYFFVLAISIFYFQERMTPLRGIGLMVILAGVILFSLGDPKLEAVRAGQ